SKQISGLRNLCLLTFALPLLSCAVARDAPMLWRLRLLGWSAFLLAGSAAAQNPYASGPQPANNADRFRYYVHRTYSWQRMSWLAADTALDHLLWEPEWGRGLGGYGCQYASGFGRRLISNSVEFGAILILRQDTRFRPSHQKGFLQRVQYATTHAFMATGP